VRQAVIGLVNRPATRPTKSNACADRAPGHARRRVRLSTGSFYVPGNFTPLEEVVELQKVWRRTAVCILPTCATKASRVLDSVKETIAIGRARGVPTQISHHKIIGKIVLGQEPSIR